MKTKFSVILTLLLVFVVQVSFAQEKKVSGTVSDNEGLPLPGATVVVSGTNSGVSTDFDGNYSIVANTGDVLSFSFVGYTTQKVKIETNNVINVVLAADNSLDEVVVVAFGTKTRDELTSAVTVVSGEALAKLSPTTSIDNMLQGIAPGVQVVAGNGKPGQTMFSRQVFLQQGTVHYLE